MGSEYSPARLVDNRDLVPLIFALRRFEVDPVLGKDEAMLSTYIAFPIKPQKVRFAGVLWDLSDKSSRTPRASGLLWMLLL